MDIANQVWNRACDDWRLENRAAGDRALAAMLLAHGWIMNGGVLDAAENLDKAQLDAAMSGYTYFGLSAVAELLLRARQGLARRSAEPVEVDRVDIGEVTIIMLEDENAERLGALEIQLDEEYTKHIPDDAALFGRFKHYLEGKPDDFARV